MFQNIVRLTPERFTYQEDISLLVRLPVRSSLRDIYCSAHSQSLQQVKTAS